MAPGYGPTKKSPAVLYGSGKKLNEFPNAIILEQAEMKFCAIHEATWGLSRDGHRRLWDDDGDDLVAADDEH
ncbi:hypothetical protein EJB05_26222, partial [Eragrostis curvula]